MGCAGAALTAERAKAETSGTNGLGLAGQTVPAGGRLPSSR